VNNRQRIRAANDLCGRVERGDPPRSAEELAKAVATIRGLALALESARESERRAWENGYRKGQERGE